MKRKTGSITLICGSMFSGKTEELIRLVRRAMHARKSVQVFKSSLETRCDTTVIQTHDGITFNAIPVADTKTLERMLVSDVQVVGIEEIQFFDEAIVSLCQRLADRGIEVIAAGLDQDFRGLPFGFMPTLLALADDVLKLHAICKVCGEEATRTQRLVNGRPAAWDEPTILIGADEAYEARCRRCHQVRNRPKDQLRNVSNTRSSAHLPTSRTPRQTESTFLPRKAKRSDAPSGRNGHTALPATMTPGDDGTQLDMFPEIDGSSDSN